MGDILAINSEEEFNEVMRLTNENKEFLNMVDYICNKFSLSYGDALIISEILMKREVPTEDILCGRADTYISEVIFENKVKNDFANNTVKNPKGNNTRTQLKSYKKKVDKMLVIGIIVGFITNGSLTMSVNGIKKYYQNKKIDSYIGMLANDNYEFTPFNKNGIVGPNVDRDIIIDFENNTITKKGDYIIDGIAEDIMKICEEHPELLDKCMHNVYFGMTTNRLKNMDMILYCLKEFTKNDPKYLQINSRLAEYRVFLDYLLDLGVVEKDSKDYEKFIQVIEEYKTVKSFENLSEDSQKFIQKVINNYKEMKQDLNDTYGGIIRKLGEEKIEETEARRGG